VDFKTVKDVSSYSKAVVDDYRKYPSHKDSAVERLKPIFDKNSEAWKIVIDGGMFVTTFRKELGKTRLKFLKKLLYALDAEWYKSIDFGI
jgi:hypothetical protein